MCLGLMAKTSRVFTGGVLLLALLSAGCGGAGGHAAPRSKDYGDFWPFTVRSGTLNCDGPGWVTLETGGETYALNGLASGRAAREGWRDLNEIWANDADVAGFGIKKSMGPLIDDGLALCNEGGGSMSVSGTSGAIGKDPNQMPSAEEQQAAGFHTFSDFTPAQRDAYIAAYHHCFAQVSSGNYFPDRDAVSRTAESAKPRTRIAAWEGCSDAVSGTPIAGSGIEPPP